MIRSTFLISILVILAAIAFKKPEQTALEFAQEFAQKTKSSLTEQGPKIITKPHFENKDDFEQRAVPPNPDKWEEISKKLRTAIEKAEKKSTASKVSVVPTIKTEPLKPTHEMAVRKSPLKHVARSNVRPSQMPRVPIPDVGIKSLREGISSKNSIAEVRSTLARPVLTEVRLNLENAARLLSEVK